MAKISEIMLLQQPEQPALAIEVQTYMKGMSQAIGENFRKNRLFIQETGRSNHGYPPFVEYPDFESLTEDRIKSDYRTEIFETLYKVTKKYNLSSSPPEE